jgi:hypothetical protein
LFIIYQRRVYVFVLPALLFLTSFGETNPLVCPFLADLMWRTQGLSVVFLLILSRPGNSVFTSSAVNFGLLYWSFSISFNVVVTALIVGRLLYVRRKIWASEQTGHSRLYFGVSAMLIESASLYSISAIVYLVGYSLSDPLQFAVEPVEIIQVRCYHLAFTLPPH